MKKEIAALILLAALVAGGFYNTHYLGQFTGGLNETLSLSRAYCENGEYAMALEEAGRASDEWRTHESYSGIFLRHTEIDAVGYGLRDLTATLASDEPEGAIPLYASLIAHIENLYEMERLSLSSIF